MSKSAVLERFEPWQYKALPAFITLSRAILVAREVARHPRNIRLDDKDRLILTRISQGYTHEQIRLRYGFGLTPITKTIERAGEKLGAATMTAPEIISLLLRSGNLERPAPREDNVRPGWLARRAREELGMVALGIGLKETGALTNSSWLGVRTVRDRLRRDLRADNYPQVVRRAYQFDLLRQPVEEYPLSLLPAAPGEIIKLR